MRGEGGCVSPGACASITVTVNALPTPAITGLNAAYCKDAGAVTLTGTPANGSFTIDGNSASQLNPANLSVGNHTVRYTVTENGCTAYTEQSVEIKALPAPAITGLANAYCKDAGAVTLTGSPANGSFTIDGNNASQLDPASLSVGNHTVRYTVTENGCTAFTEQSVEIKALPTPSITGLTNAYCKDAGAVTLTGTPASGSFTIDGNSTSQLDPANLSVGSHTVRYTVTENGCTAFTEQSVEIKALPTPAITGLNAAYCKDAGAVTLTGSPASGSFTIDGNSASQLDPASLSVGNHTVRYTVSENGCTNFMDQSVEIKALPTPAITGLNAAYCKDAGAVALTGTPSGGSFTIDGQSAAQLNPASLNVGNHTVRYTVTVNGCTNSSSQDVTVNPLPTVTPGSDKSVIFGYGSNCTDITATASGMGSLTYTWSPSGTPAGILIMPTVQVCPEATTTYEVTVTDGNGCANTAQVKVNVQVVRCGPKLNMVTICYYGVTQCVSEKTAKNYLKLGATLGGCGGSNARIGIPEINERSLQLSLKAFPNPVQDLVTVEILAPNAGAATFEVLDLTGRVRQTRKQELTEGLNEVEFRLGTLPTGVYLIRSVGVQNRQGVVRVSKE